MKAIALLVIFLSATIALGEEITGAFGINLGEKFEMSSAIGESKLEDGTPIYQFTPKSPYRTLEKYFVLLTPQTRQVYSIWAIGEFSEKAEAIKEQSVLAELLSKKYGQLTEPSGFSASIKKAKRLSVGGRSVLLLVDGFSSANLEIRYYDEALKALAEKERISIEAAKADPSGL